MKNYYRILRVYPTATEGLVREAYKARMQELMDGLKDIPQEEAEELIAETREAFALLSDPTARSRYDRRLLEFLMTGATEEREMRTSRQQASPPASTRIRDELLRDGEKKVHSIRDYLRRQPEFRGSAPAERHLLQEYSEESEPVQTAKKVTPETVGSLEEGLSAAASLVVDQQFHAALSFLKGLRERWTDDPLQAKVVFRTGELYLKHLHSPEIAIESYREVAARFPASVDAYMAERRLAELEPLAPKSGMEIPRARLREEVGDLLVVECPNCGATQNIPNRRNLWFICTKCGERFSV